MANRKKKRKLNYRGITVLSLLVLMLCFLVVIALDGGEEKPLTAEPYQTEEENTAVPGTSSSVPAVTEKKVVSTASLGVVGDILIHEKVYLAAKAAGGGEYDFTENYEYVKKYFSQYDYTVANLEVTLGGEDPVVGKYPNAYPSFNSPDSVVDALKGAGVDLLLTANNHSYDTRAAGLARTVEIVRKKGLENLGTRETMEESFYPVKNINGIKVGMACFTYCNSIDADGKKNLNGIPVSKEASPLIAGFSYDRLDEFYAEAETAVAEMKENGAEAVVFYLHWGDEYKNEPNRYQKQMAEKLCSLGVDVIIGGHPHVVQPFEVLTGENGHKTYCIYSVGNALSNQRREEAGLHVYGGRTEDGMIFGLTFEKWSDGSVNVAEVDIQPLWVIREERGGRYVYQIIPLDLSVSDWQTFGLSENMVNEARASYLRTMTTVGNGLNSAREALGLSPRPLQANKTDPD